MIHDSKARPTCAPSRLPQGAKIQASTLVLKRFVAQRPEKCLLPGRAEGRITSMETTKQQA